ncbi:MAG TPA: protein kinase [Actinomycetota bacterium]|nr:protein kinase [Actinomycetota bacterium]
MTQRILNDRYRVEGVLGEGGMSSVWRGVDTVLGRPVAIKVLRPRRGDDSFVARFRREAQAAAALNHPNIVSVYDTGSDDGVQYIVMELVEGETLADLLRREGRLPPQRAAEIGAAIAQALHAAHGAGLVHRDVKPGNVMVTPAGEVKVMDFGIARAAADDTLTQTGTVVGTAAYLAPEQARGGKADPRSDAYALGCVLYEMVTGTPPFTGDSAVQVAYQHVNEEPRSPSEIVPVPADLEAVIMRALAKDPDQRFPSAKAMLNALSGSAAGQDTAPGPPPTDVMPTAALPTLRSRRWWPVVAAVVGLLLVGAGLFALAAGDGGTGRRDPDRPRAAAKREARRTPSPPATVAEAFDSIEQVVADAAFSGGMSEDAAKKLLERSQNAEAAYLSGNPVSALEELAKAQEDIAKALSDGEMTEPAAIEVSLAFGQARSLLEDLPAPSPSPTPTPEEEEEEGGDGGPGNSEFAPGHNKGKGKGEDD